jgi:hypothetical protein
VTRQRARIMLSKKKAGFKLTPVRCLSRFLHFGICLCGRVPEKGTAPYVHFFIVVD